MTQTQEQSELKGTDAVEKKIEQAEAEKKMPALPPGATQWQPDPNINYFLLEEPVLVEMLNYLATKPFKEVEPIINKLRRLPNAAIVKMP